jgi:hypothetical protein
MFSSCGKRRPPQPPAERVAQRVEIKGKQIGDRIDISWIMPARNASVGDTLQISRVDIYRLAEPLSDTLSLTEQEFDSRSTLIGSLPVVDSDFGLKLKTYSDKLQIVSQTVRLRYAIKFVNSAGQKAAYSNFFLIEPAANIASAPSAVRTSVSQNSIGISWTAPLANLDGSSPPNVVGYNIYRKEAADVFKLITDKPLNALRFEDDKFDFGKEYQYFIRTVSLGSNAVNVEGFSSETVSAKPVDTFAPSPPDSLTIASAPSSISLFFAFNLEKDVAGYRVYRSTNPDLDKKQWELMTTELLDSNTFQDTSGVANVVYYYYAVAIDKFGNVSAPSVVVFETAL